MDEIDQRQMKKAPEQILVDLINIYEESSENIQSRFANIESSQQQDHSRREYKRFREVFLKRFRNDSEYICSLEEFAIYFLNAVRQQTEMHLRAVHESDTPKCLTPARTLASIVSGIEPSSITPTIPLQIQDTTPTPASAEVLNTSDVATNSLDQSSFTQALQCNTSTPVRRITPTVSGSFQGQQSQRRSAGNYTPKSNEKSSTRNGSNSASSGLCLGDFLVMNTTITTRSNKKQKTPQHGSAVGETTPTGRPKKRVVPTQISTRNNKKESKDSNVGDTSNTAFPFGNSKSSFSNENNLLQMSLTEIDDENKCSIRQARKSLKLNASEISKELQSDVASLHSKAATINSEFSLASAAVSVPEEVVPRIRVDSVSERAVKCLAHVYACLIDANLTVNVLNEISFLLNLLNASEQKTTTGEECTEGTLTLLNNSINCIYFAVCVLQQQRHVIASLDHKSLSVVLNNERLSSLAKDLKSYLEAVHRQKQQLETEQKLLDTSIRLDKSSKSVYYHVEKNTREYFSSNSEFDAFKTQRDLFYAVLKIWETNHLSPTWNFSDELSQRIQNIFHQSENPVNMAHFAELFVAQLLISSDDSSSPEEIGLEVDRQKFSRLQQRLVAPSNFSVDYQFPRSQAFFRDFINEARSLVFVTQLKLALFNELIKLNDSTFEHINLKSHANNDELEDNAALLKNDGEYQEYIVRAEILGSMLVLAKFFGYVTTLPFNLPASNSNAIPDNIEKKQIMLRSLFQPDFNMRQLLLKAIRKGKLLITLPWLVQYLAMLDNVTLQLEACKESLQLLFDMYKNLGIIQTSGALTAENGSSLDAELLPTSSFIIRCCLGWLLETKPIIAEQYYAYNAEWTLKHKATELPEMTTELAKYTAQEKAHDVLQLNAILESLLNTACPFLAEFRVSIMPAKQAMTKYVSRTGRYRHIRTRLAEPNAIARENAAHEVCDKLSSKSKQECEQDKLIDAFMHSQNTSMHRLLEFTIERTYKAVIKDAQYKIFLPSKAAADSKINEITSRERKHVYAQVDDIYTEAREKALSEWNAQIPGCIEDRVNKALDALLAEDTPQIIKQTYFLLIQRNAMQKVLFWRQQYLYRNNYYCNDLLEMTDKICKANSRRDRQPQLSSVLEIKKALPSVSDTLDDLQYWLHCTSMRADLIKHPDPIVAFLRQLPLCFTNTLPTICYRLIGSGIVQLLQHIIVRHPLLLTQPLVNAACSIWLTSEMQNADKFPIKETRIDEDVDESHDDAAFNFDDNYCKPIYNSEVYEGLITVAFIQKLNTERICYDKLLYLLLEMVKKKVITVEFLNVRFVPIFKEDWPAKVLNEISRLLQTIAKETAGSASGDFVGHGNNRNDRRDSDTHKSQLFMEVLADLSRDVDDF